MIICSVVSLSAMVLTYKMSQTTSNITKTCNKCTNFIKTIKATTQFVVFLFVHSWEQRKVSEMFKVTRGYVLASTLTEAVKTDKKPYPVYSSQTKDNGLMGYYKDYLYEDAITWTTDGANAGTVNYRAGKFYCTNVCGVLLSNEVTANQMIAEALNNVAKGYVSYVGNPKLMNNVMADIEIMIPTQSEEREKLSVLFRNLDNLITLHQREFFRLILAFFCCNSTSILPISWEQRKFEDFFTERNERSGNGEMISVTIGSGIKKFDELNRFDKKPDDLSKYKRVEVGDIAYNSMRMWQGASGYSPYSGILSPAYTVITPKNGVSSRFFAYVLKQPKMIHQFEINSQGLTKDTWNLKFPAFAPIEVVAPLQLAEQEKVSELLLQLDNLITLHQRECLPKTCSLASWFYQQTNRKMTSFWEQRKLGDVGTTFTGLSGKTKEDFGHGNAGFVTYMNVFSNPIADLTQCEKVEIDSKQAQVKCGDIFFTTSSETPEEVGMSSIWLGKQPNIYLNSFCFGYRPSIPTNPYYLGFMLRSASVRKKFILLAQGISRYNISKNKAMEIVVSIPSDNEQKKVGTFFKEIDNLITLHQRIKINITGDYHDKKDK